MAYRDRVSGEAEGSLEDEREGLLLDEKDQRLSLSRLTYLSRYHHHTLLIIELVLLVATVGLLLFTFVVVRPALDSSEHGHPSGTDSTWLADHRPSTTTKTVYVTSTPTASPSGSNYVPPEPPFAPGRDELRYKNIDYFVVEDPDDMYTGEWTQEKNDAWERLMYYNTLRFSEEEMTKIGVPSMEYTDGGYYGFLEGYHQLHCIQRIWQGKYPEHYPELVQAGHLSDAHWNHCLQVLRRGVMCQPSLHVNTIINDSTHPPLNMTAILTGPRQCVDWDHWEQELEKRDMEGAGVIDLYMQGKFGENGPKKVWESYSKEHGLA